MVLNKNAYGKRRAVYKIETVALDRLLRGVLPNGHYASTKGHSNERSTNNRSSILLFFSFLF